MPTFICFRLVEIPIACILAIFLGMGQNGVFWSIVIAESLPGILGIWLFTRDILKKKMV